MTEPEKDPGSGCTSFKTDIRPMFTKEDVDHMKDQVGMDLDDYDTVKTNAESILLRLTDKDNPMPPAPKGPWPPEWIACFKQWMANGKQP